MEKYLVGGAVRDKLLNKSCNDKDYVIVGATVEEMLAKGYKQIGKDFPVFLDENGCENALARLEKKCGERHTDFEVSFSPDVTLEEDLSRRDLTVNAIAMDKDGNYLDPYDGITDLHKGLLRHINKHFVEDPLRVLRVARFAAQLGFTISPDTKALCKWMNHRNMLANLSPERVWKELEKSLSKGYDSRRFFETLNEINGLGEWFEEIDRLTQSPEKLCYHPSGNSFAHTMIALDRVKDCESLVKFAVLCHDLGKGLTPFDILPQHIGHEERGLTAIDSLCDRLCVPNDYRKFAKLFCKHHMKLYRVLEMRLAKQYKLVKELSENFRNKDLLANIIQCFYADFCGEDVDIKPEDKYKFDNTVTRLWEIYQIMENKGLKDLEPTIQQRLEKLKGEKFGEAYEQAMVRYLAQAINKKEPI